MLTDQLTDTLNMPSVIPPYLPSAVKYVKNVKVHYDYYYYYITFTKFTTFTENEKMSSSPQN